MTTILVPAQTDPQYSAISSNQCSWCAVEFALHSKQLASTFLDKDSSAFLTLYNQCMLEASQKRKELGTFLYGENIDSANLLHYYKPYLEILHKNSIKLNDDPTFVDILHKDLKSEFYERMYADHLTIDSILERMPYHSFLLVSRHGQSLCVIRMMSYSFLILDSHLHIAQHLNKEDTKKHILMDNGGHTLVTLLFGV